jgi:hypothetical protein
VPTDITHKEHRSQLLATVDFGEIGRHVEILAAEGLQSRRSPGANRPPGSLIEGRLLPGTTASINIFTSWLDLVTRIGAQFSHNRRDEWPHHDPLVTEHP